MLYHNYIVIRQLRQHVLPDSVAVASVVDVAGREEWGLRLFGDATRRHGPVGGVVPEIETWL